jgi:hypothetical protein
MHIYTLRLKERPFIPVEPQPCQGVENRLCRFLRRPNLIGIFNPEKKFPPGVPGIKPGKESCSRPDGAKRVLTFSFSVILLALPIALMTFL